MNEWKTAIKRTKPSRPMAWLSKNSLLVGRVLDFGCGQGFDASHFNLEKYDPKWSPNLPEGRFDTITCNYVLNVIESQREREVIDQITSLLNPGGIAYITVRRDVKRDGFTKRGTYQRMVTLNAEVIVENNGFCIYKLCL